jgi:hypothetical protein
MGLIRAGIKGAVVIGGARMVMDRREQKEQDRFEKQYAQQNAQHNSQAPYPNQAQQDPRYAPSPQYSNQPPNGQPPYQGQQDPRYAPQYSSQSPMQPPYQGQYDTRYAPQYPNQPQIPSQYGPYQGNNPPPVKSQQIPQVAAPALGSKDSAPEKPPNEPKVAA